MTVDVLNHDSEINSFVTLILTNKNINIKLSVHDAFKLLPRLNVTYHFNPHVVMVVISSHTFVSTSLKIAHISP